MVGGSGSGSGRGVKCEWHPVKLGSQTVKKTLFWAIGN